MSTTYTTDMGSWTTWKDYIGDLDLDAIYALGNQWIAMGDALYSENLNYIDAIGALAWKGEAFTTAQDAWINHMSVVLNDAADAAWKAGEAINAYGKSVHDQAQKMADENNKAYLINIFSFFLGVITAPLTFGLGGLLSLVGRIIGSLVDVMTRLASRLGALGTTAVDFTGEAATSAASSTGVDMTVNGAGEAATRAASSFGIDMAANVIGGAGIGAGSSFGIDMAANGLASAATHTPVTVNWKNEGLNIGLGAAFGGGMGAGLSFAGRGGGGKFGDAGAGGEAPTPNFPKPPEIGKGDPTPVPGTGDGAGTHAPPVVKPADVSVNGPGLGGDHALGGDGFNGRPALGDGAVSAPAAKLAPNEPPPTASAPVSGTAPPRTFGLNEKASGAGTPMPGDGRVGTGGADTAHPVGTQGSPPPVPGPPRSGGPVDGHPQGPEGSSHGPVEPGATANGGGTAARPVGSGEGHGDSTAVPQGSGRAEAAPPSNLEKEPTSSGPVSTPPGGQAPKTGVDQGSTGSHGSGDEPAVVNGPDASTHVSVPPSGAGHGVPGAEVPRMVDPGAGGASAPVNRPVAQPSGGSSPDAMPSNTPSGGQDRPSLSPGGRQGKSAAGGGGQSAPPSGSTKPLTSGDGRPPGGESGHQETPPGGGQSGSSGPRSGGTDAPSSETPVANAPSGGHDQPSPAPNGGRDNPGPDGQGSGHQEAPTSSGPTARTQQPTVGAWRRPTTGKPPVFRTRQLLRTDPVTGESHLVDVVGGRRRDEPAAGESPLGAPASEHAGTSGPDAPDRYRYYEADPRTGAVNEVHLGPNDAVVRAEPAGGQVHSMFGYKDGRRIPVGDPGERMAVFNKTKGTWGVADLAAKPTGSGAVHVTAPPGRTAAPPQNEAKFYQVLRRGGDGNIDLLTYPRRPENVPPSGGAKNDGDQYHELNDGGPAGWHDAHPFGAGAPKVERIITAPGRRLDGNAVESSDPPAVLVRDHETGLYEKITQFASGGKAGDPAGGTYYRVGPNGEPQPVEFNSEKFDIVKVSPKDGTVTRTTFSFSGDDTAAPYVGKDGTLSPAPQKMSAGELRFDPDTGRITHSEQNSAGSYGRGPGDGSDRPGGGGKGTATRSKPDGSLTHTQTNARTFIDDSATSHGASSSKPSDGEDPGAAMPAEDRFPGEGKSVGGSSEHPGSKGRADAFEKLFGQNNAEPSPGSGATELGTSHPPAGDLAETVPGQNGTSREHTEYQTNSGPSKSGGAGQAEGASTGAGTQSDLGHAEADDNPVSSRPVSTPPGGKAPKTGGDQGPIGSGGSADESKVVEGNLRAMGIPPKMRAGGSRADFEVGTRFVSNGDGTLSARLTFTSHETDAGVPGLRRPVSPKVLPDDVRALVDELLNSRGPRPSGLEPGGDTAGLFAESGRPEVDLSGGGPVRPLDLGPSSIRPGPKNLQEAIDKAWEDLQAERHDPNNWPDAPSKATAHPSDPGNQGGNDTPTSASHRSDADALESSSGDGAVARKARDMALAAIAKDIQRREAAAEGVTRASAPTAPGTGTPAGSAKHRYGRPPGTAHGKAPATHPATHPATEPATEPQSASESHADDLGSALAELRDAETALAIATAQWANAGEGTSAGVARITAAENRVRRAAEAVQAAMQAAQNHGDGSPAGADDDLEMGGAPASGDRTPGDADMGEPDSAPASQTGAAGAGGDVHFGPATSSLSLSSKGSGKPLDQQPVPASAPQRQPPSRMLSPVDEATRLAGLPRDERMSELQLMSADEREALASDPDFVRWSRMSLPPAEFASVVAHLMINVPSGVEQPVAARRRLHSIIAQMLSHDPRVAENVVNAGGRVFVIPRNEPLTSLRPWRVFTGKTINGRLADQVRSVRTSVKVAVSEENLLGETSPFTVISPPGYSDATYQFAHLIYAYGLSGKDKQYIRGFHHKKRRQAGAMWPDGPLSRSSAHGVVHRSAGDPGEYFAQLTNAYFATNAGHDPYTHHQRLNGLDALVKQEPVMIRLLRRIYGEDDRGIEDANPREHVRAENDRHAGFRAFWEMAEAADPRHPDAPADTSPPISSVSDGELPPVDEATRLAGLSPGERFSELQFMSADERELLASDPQFVHGLRLSLPPAEFASAVAQLMIRVSGEVEQPATAGQRLHEITTRMLSHNPDVAENVINAGGRVFIIPRNRPLTSLGPWRDSAGASSGGRSFDQVRGNVKGSMVAVGEESLLGEASPIIIGAHDTGYSVATHELAHLIHGHGLTVKDRKLISRHFAAKWRTAKTGARVPWPDGVLTSVHMPGKINYSATNEWEYFAQLTNAYLGTNSGMGRETDWPRNNGVGWVRRHEAPLLPLLERIYGVVSEGGHETNPLRKTQQENRLYRAFREFAGEPGEEVPALPDYVDMPIISGEFDPVTFKLAFAGRPRDPGQTALWLVRNTNHRPGDPVTLVAPGAGTPGPAGEPSFADVLAVRLDGPVIVADPETGTKTTYRPGTASSGPATEGVTVAPASAAGAPAAAQKPGKHIRWADQAGHSPAQTVGSAHDGSAEGDHPAPATAESGMPADAYQQVLENAFGPPRSLTAPVSQRPGLVPLDEIRPYGRRGGLDHAAVEEQRALEGAFPRNADGSFQRFPNPRSLTYFIAGPVRALNRQDPRNTIATEMGTADWLQRINPGWRDDFRRQANCTDAARSVLASWYGVPTVAAPLYAGDDAFSGHPPNPSDHIEEDGSPRTSQWLNTGWRTHDPAEQAWDAVAQRVRDGGHGSSAIVVFLRPAGTVHAVNALNYDGSVFWVDGAWGRISRRPLYVGTQVMSIELDPNSMPIDRVPPLWELGWPGAWSYESEEASHAAPASSVMSADHQPAGPVRWGALYTGSYADLRPSGSPSRPAVHIRLKPGEQAVDAGGDTADPPEKQVRWADEEGGDLTQAVDAGHDGSARGGSTGTSAPPAAFEDVLDQTRLGMDGDRPVAIWLPGALEDVLRFDGPTIARLGDLVPPQTVFVMADVRDGEVVTGGRPVPVSTLAAVIAARAPGYQPFLLTPGSAPVAGPLAEATGGPVLAAPHGVHHDPSGGTLTALAGPDTAGSHDLSTAGRFRLYLPGEPGSVPMMPVLTAAPAPGALPPTSASRSGSATTDSGDSTEPQRGTPSQPGPDDSESGQPPGPDGMSPTTVDPAALSRGIPRAGLPYMPELIRVVRRELAAHGVTPPEPAMTGLVQRLLGNFPHTLGDSRDDANTSGYMDLLGDAELLVTFDPTDPHTVDNTAGSTTGPSLLPAPAGEHFVAESVNAAYATGAHVETRSGQTGQTKGMLSLSVGIGLDNVRVGGSVSGTANQSGRGSSRTADVEVAHVEYGRTGSTLLAYRPNISVKVRTSRADGQTPDWERIKPIRIQDPGTEKLLLWLHGPYVKEPAAEQVTATGAEVKPDALPSHYYASGLTNKPKLFDEIAGALASQGLKLKVGGFPRAELLQKLSNLDAHLDKAVGDKERGYRFTLHDKRGSALATVQVHSERLPTGTRRVGATSAELHLDNSATAVDGVGGSHTLTQSSTVTPLSVEFELVRLGDLGLDASVSASYTESNSDSVSASRIGGWALASRYGGHTAAYTIEFEHRAKVNVRGGSKKPSARTMTPVVRGRGLVRVPEPDAFEYGLPVDKEALKQPPEGGTVPYRPDAVRGTGRRPEDPETKPVPEHLLRGKGVGTGQVQVPRSTADAIRSALTAELKGKGFLPEDDGDPFAGEHWYTHGNKVISRLDNQELLDKMLAGLGSHYDLLHQDGMTFTMRRRRGTAGVDLDVDSAKVTIKAQQRPDTPPRYVRSTGEYHLQNLAIGKDSAAQSAGHSRKIAVGFAFKTLFRFLKATLMGVEFQRTAGATDAVSFLNMVLQLALQLHEFPETLDEWELTSDYHVSVEYQHSGWTGKIGKGRRDRSLPAIERQTAVAHLLPLNIEPPPSADDSVQTVNAERMTPRDVLDQAVVYHLDATGLRAAAAAVLEDLVGPAGAADRDVSAFAGLTSVRGHLKEILNGEYTTDQPFDSGLFRDTFGALDISGSLGPSTFAGATANQIVLGIIKVILLENKLSDLKSSGITWEQLGAAFGDVAGQASLTGGWDFSRRWQRNNARSNGRASGKEVVRVDFNRAYAYAATVDFTVKGRQEKHAKLLPSSTSRPEPRRVDQRDVVYLLSELEALRRYADHTLPVSDAQLTDVMTRWRGGKPRLTGDVVAGLLTRWRSDLAARADAVPADLEFVDGLARDLARFHDTGGLRVLDPGVRRAFGAAFGRPLAEPRAADQPIDMPDDLVQYSRGGPALPGGRLADAMTAWRAGELALSGDVAAGILRRWATDVPDLPATPRVDRDGMVAALSAWHAQGAVPVRDPQVRQRFNETFGRELPEPPLPFDEVELPEYLTRNDRGGRLLGHSGIRDFGYRNGKSTYQIVKEQIDEVAPGMLTAGAELWDRRGRVIGRMQGGVDALQSLLAKGRDQSMLENLLAGHGYSFYLVNPTGWLLADVVEINLSDVLTSAPKIGDFMPDDGVEMYEHGFVNKAESNSRDGAQSFTFATLGIGGRGPTTGSGGADLKVSEGHHRGTTRAESVAASQTLYDWTGHYPVGFDHELTVTVRRLDMSGRPLNNLLQRTFDRWTRHSATSTVTAPGSLVIQLPRTLAEAGRMRGPEQPPDLTPLPELPGAITGAILDDALPIGLDLLRRMFPPSTMEKLLGATAEDPRTRSSLSLPTLLSRLHLINHLRPAATNQRRVETGQAPHTLAENLFIPGHSEHRATLWLEGDLSGLDVIGPAKKGSGTGRYSKYQSGTTVSASTDHIRTVADASAGVTGPMAQHTPPDTWSPGIAGGRVTSFDDGAAGTENSLVVQHVKEFGPLYVVRMRFRGRLIAEKYRHHLFRDRTPMGRFTSDPISGDVYAEIYQAQIEELHAQMEAARAKARPQPPSRPRMQRAPAFDLAPLLADAARGHLGAARAYQGIARHIRQNTGAGRPVILTADERALTARTHQAVLRWAVRTMSADLAEIRQTDPTVPKPPALDRYELQLDKVGPAAGSVDSIQRATTEIINAVNDVHAQRPDNPAGAPAEPPPEATVWALDPVYVGRDVAYALNAHVRVDVTRPDGTARQTWIDPDGRTYAFDPARTRTDDDTGGAVWVFDPATSRNRFFTAAVAETNGLLTAAQRADADAYGLTYGDMGRLYLTAPARDQMFGQAFNAEIATRAHRLASLNPVLPELLHRAAEAHAFWRQEAERLQRRQNDEDPLGLILEPSERIRRAESAARILGLLRASARSGPGDRTWTEDDVRAIADRLDEAAHRTASAPGDAPPADDSPAVPAGPVTAPEVDGGLSAPQAATLTRMGLSMIPVPAFGDELIHALGAVATAEIAAIGNGRPPTAGEARAHLADALTADLQLDPGERRFWPALDAHLTVPHEPEPAGGAGPAGPGQGSTDGRRRAAVATITAPDGTDEADRLTLAAAAVVLGLRTTVVPPDGVPVDFGPSPGRRIVLARLAAPGPHTGSWGATEPVADRGPASSQGPAQATASGARRVPPRTQVPAAPGAPATADPAGPSSAPRSGGSRARADRPPMANLGVDPFARGRTAE